MRTTGGSPRGRAASPGVRGARTVLAALAVLAAGCSSGPDPDQARARTEQVLEEVGVAALPEDVVTAPLDAADVEGCTTERVHRIRLDLAVPEGVDLLADLREAWQDEGELVEQPESLTLTLDDGYQLVASTSRGSIEQAGLRAQSPCFEAAP